ncbi:MAG: response regulator [Anaerolineae bacterium]
MKTILVVDDYTVTQRVLGHILRQGGYNPLMALNGREALDILQENAVDLVICDIAMPEMDGLELLLHLRNDERFVNLPVVMLTASGQDVDRVVAEESGANGFLLKPTSSGELIETIVQFLG